MNLLGINIGDLGTHSLRKGVATLIAAGCTVSPPITAICIRVGWAMGGVKERYLHYAAAGDQYVGRCAALLNQTDKSFAASPPYFDFTEIEDSVERGKVRQAVCEYMCDCIPNNNIIEAHTLHLVYMCFASICYHHTYLMENLHRDSPFRIAPIFKDLPSHFIKLTKVAHLWNKTADTPAITGIPPNIVIIAELEIARKEFSELKSSLISGLATDLNNRGIGDSSFFRLWLLNIWTRNFRRSNPK